MVEEKKHANAQTNGRTGITGPWYIFHLHACKHESENLWIRISLFKWIRIFLQIQKYLNAKKMSSDVCSVVRSGRCHQERKAKAPSRARQLVPCYLNSMPNTLAPITLFVSWLTSQKIKDLSIITVWKVQAINFLQEYSDFKTSLILFLRISSLFADGPQCGTNCCTQLFLGIVHQSSPYDAVHRFYRGFSGTQQCNTICPLPSTVDAN